MESDQNPFQAAIKAGLIIGLIQAVIIFLAYFIDYELLSSGWFGLLSLVITCGLTISYGIAYRKTLGGFMKFGPAYRFSFFTLLIMLIMVTFANLILYIGIDPTLPGKMADLGVENTVEIMDRFGVGDSLSSDQIEDMKTNLLEGYSLSGLIRGSGMMLVFNAILALVLGAIIKKKDKSSDY